MSYRVVPTKHFQKTFKKYYEGGKRHTLQSVADVIDLLSIHDERSLYVLSTRWKDHMLKGNKGGIRELHLSQDDLLLYTLDQEQKIIKLLDIVSHEELRTKK